MKLSTSSGEHYGSVLRANDVYRYRDNDIRYRVVNCILLVSPRELRLR